MKAIFCVYGYSPESERLQPWLTVHEVASVLIAFGWEVHLITDVNRQPTLVGLHHHYVKTMRPSNAAEIRHVINAIAPDRVVVLATPLNLMLPSWYKFIRCPLFAFLSYPFYTIPEIVRALPHLAPHDMLTYGRHALVPGFIWKNTLRTYFTAVIAQSTKTSNRVAAAVGPGFGAYGLRAGLDLDFWKPAERVAFRDPSVTRFLYVGSAKAIRGFNVLLDAFCRLPGQSAELKILARGSTPGEVSELQRTINERAIDNQIEIVGGWMDRECLREEVRTADVAVLPFVLVPSELPVSVIECIACGTPVIATDIDGLPDAVGKAGVIVRSGSVTALLEGMNELVSDKHRINSLREECMEERNNMLDWAGVGREWLQVLSR